MILSEFLTALDADIKVSIVETDLSSTENELIRMFSGDDAVSQLSAEILAREIDKISVFGKSYLKLHLSTGTDNV